MSTSPPLPPSLTQNIKTKPNRKTKAVRMYCTVKPDSALVAKLVGTDGARLKVLVAVWERKVYLTLSLWHHFSSSIWRGEARSLVTRYHNRTSKKVWLPVEAEVSKDIILAAHWCGLVGTDAFFLRDVKDMPQFVRRLDDGELDAVTLAVGMAIGKLPKVSAVIDFICADNQTRGAEGKVLTEAQARLKIIEGFRKIRAVEAGKEAA